MKYEGNCIAERVIAWLVSWGWEKKDASAAVEEYLHLAFDENKAYWEMAKTVADYAERARKEKEAKDGKRN